VSEQLHGARIPHCQIDDHTHQLTTHAQPTTTLPPAVIDLGEAYTVRGRLHMDRWDLLAAAGTLVSIFLPLIIVFVGSGKQWRAAQDRARERRMVEHRMNARLLRLNI
jgi:hypothetical protein